MLSYAQRAAHSVHPLGRRLLRLMEEKETNLAVAVDVLRGEELLRLGELLGPEIALLKTHIDILEDFTPELTVKLRTLAEKHDFLLFEDRKFADIGKTVQLQYERGLYHIAEWADIVNAHILPGPGIIEGLKEVGLPRGRALLLLAEMSAKGNFATHAYTEAAVRLAEAHADFVVGFIAMRKLSQEPSLIHMTPGVHLAAVGDALGQHYLTPEEVILHRQSDLLIVGRGITHAPDPLQAARTYREQGWLAYRHRLKNIS